jgi:hypothetical protein
VRSTTLTQATLSLPEMSSITKWPILLRGVICPQNTYSTLSVIRYSLAYYRSSIRRLSAFPILNVLGIDYYYGKPAEEKFIIVPLPESFLLLQAQSLMFGLEELTRGLRNLYRTEKSTIWLCFAMKIFFDINHFHRAESGKAFDELKAFVHAAKIRLHQMISVTARLSRAPNGMMIRFETPHFRRRMDYQRRN